MPFSGLNPVEILEFGLIGFGFLLALFTFWLLFREQNRLNDLAGATPIFKPIYMFMGFSGFLIVLGLVAQHYSLQPIKAAVISCYYTGTNYDQKTCLHRIADQHFPVEAQDKRDFCAESPGGC